MAPRLLTAGVAAPVPEGATTLRPWAAQKVIEAICAVLTVACGFWALSDLVADDPSEARVASASTRPEGPRIRIPAIDVDAKVVSLGLTSAGALETPADVNEAGWWSGGSAPGEPGPAVIVAHRDSAHGPALFYALPTLTAGTTIDVYDAHGEKHTYVVDHLERHDRDTFPTKSVYGATPRATLRLLTCGGRFDPEDGYEDNHIVFAHLQADAPSRP